MEIVFTRRPDGAVRRDSEPENVGKKIIDFKMQHAWVRREMYTVFWSENLKGSGLSEDIGIDGKIILEWILEKQGGKL
jgi:hypothetical protein